MTRSPFDPRSTTGETVQTPTSLADLEAELQGLEAELNRETASGRRAALASAGVALAIVVIVLGFAWSGYTQFKEALTADKLAIGLQREMNELNPSATRELQQLGRALLPVYTAETRRQFDSLAPEIGRRLGEQLQLIGTDLHKDIHDRLNDLEDDLQQQTERAILDCYPSLANDEQRARVDTAFEAITESAVVGAITDFDQRFAKDVDHVRDCLAKFTIAESTEPSVELQKRFISLWLQMLDQEIQKL
jgi:hypothetical protein